MVIISGSAVKRDKTEMGGGEGGESVSHPILIVGRIMKRGGWSMSVRVVIRWVWF